jgi:hypothetical protein
MPGMPVHIQCMAQSLLIFDFGDEEAAQRARHRIDGWKQGFRLDKKLQLKFDRKETEGKQEAAGSGPSAQPEIRLIVRLDFSDHEKLSHQRWLERIPAEGSFKDAKLKVVRSGDPEFAATAEHFDSLEHPPKRSKTAQRV